MLWSYLEFCVWFWWLYLRRIFIILEKEQEEANQGLGVPSLQESAKEFGTFLI